MTALVIKIRIDVYDLTQVVGSTLEYLRQQQVDQVFSEMVEDLDDPET